LSPPGFIIHVGWEVTSDIVIHLMDGVDPELLAAAEAAALTVAGVQHVHARARWTGGLSSSRSKAFSPAPLRSKSPTNSARRYETPSPKRAVLWSPHALPT
jgi:hypothetical protein